MIILAIDTCNSSTSVTITNNNVILFEQIDSTPDSQAEKLLYMIDEALKSNNMKLENLNYIALSVGPGSFTGVRIGISAILGLTMFSKTKIIAVSCTEALAYEYINSNIMVAMDARRDNLYIQNFSKNNAISEIYFVSKNEALNYLPNGEFVIVGSGSEIIADEILKVGRKIQAFNLIVTSTLIARAAYIKIKNNKMDLEVKPLYIREANARK